MDDLEEPVDQPHRTRNRDVAQLLEAIAELLDVKGEQGFRVNAYRNAARRVEGLREPIERVHAEGRLRGIPGIGEALEQKIGEFLTTGRLGYYERLRSEFPPGMVELLQVPGLGPRKARVVFDQLGIGSLEELEEAARSGRLRDVPGLGEKTEQGLLREIERLGRRDTRHQLGLALAAAETLVEALRDCPGVDQVAYVGSLRRMVDTIGDVNLLVATDRWDEVGRYFSDLPQVREVLPGEEGRVAITIADRLRVDLRFARPEHWGAALIWHTGSTSHLRRLEERAREQGRAFSARGLTADASGAIVAGRREEDVYEALGLQPIAPELREDGGEIELAARRALPRLVEVGDLRGDLHVHSNWSDGGSPLEEMARAARALGHQYIAMTDHSKSLGVARGLTEERVAQQATVLRALNAQLAPFRVLHGTEMDIKRNGRLDYDDETLARLEYVSASIHSGMKQERAVMTERILRAIGNPYVATLNHPHGRLIGSRPAYDVDMDAVVRAAVACGVALEINSQPARMDLDGAWARRARAAGAKFVINTDSHATGQLGLMRFGVATARRAWLSPADVLNCLPLDELLAQLAARRPQRTD